MARALVDHGWQVDVIAWFRGRSPPEVNESDLAEMGVRRWHWVHQPTTKRVGTLLAALPRLYRRVQACLDDIAAVQLCLLNHVALLPMAGRLPGRVIYDASERWVISMSSEFGRLEPAFRPLLAALERRFCRSTAAITTMDSPNDWLAQHYRKTGKPVVVLRNVPSLQDSPFQYRPVEDDSGQDSPGQDSNGRAQAATLAYVGGIDADRGVKLLLATLQSVRASRPDAEICLIGPSKRWDVDLKPFIAELGLSDAVHMHGYLPYRHAVRTLATAQIGLALYQPSRLTYHYAGAGNARKIMTYMQAGLPVIGPSFGALGDLIRHYDCGVLVDTTDLDAIVEAVIGLLNDPGERARLGANGRAAIETELNWQRERVAFDQLIDSLA